MPSRTPSPTIMVTPAPEKKSPTPASPGGVSLSRSNTISGELIEVSHRLSGAMLGEFDLKAPRNDMFSKKEPADGLLSANASSDAMKHFHSAALDYMWRREAQTSKNWRIRLYVLMEVRQRPARSHLCPATTAPTPETRGVGNPNPNPDHNPNRCRAPGRSPSAWRSF